MQDTAFQTPAKRPHWSAHELVVLGVFAATTKVLSLLIALAGGGMNPVSLLAKNLIYTTLLIIMLYKVRKTGTLSLFVLVNILISMLLMGGSATLIPSMFGAALVAELLLLGTGGVKKSWGPLLAVGLFDFFYRIFSLGMSWLYVRENPAMLYMAIPIIGLGYIGALIGLYTGYKSVGELRHAGIVRS